MNQVKGGGSRRIPVSINEMMGGKAKDIPREQWAHHPSFATNVHAELNKATFPKEEIAADFHEMLRSALIDIAFPALNIPSAIYFKFINCHPDTYKFGELQKAVDIVWNAKPKQAIPTAVVAADNAANPLAETLNAYHSQVIKVHKMRSIFEDIIAPIHEKVIDALILQEAPSIIKK